MDPYLVAVDIVQDELAAEFPEVVACVFKHFSRNFLCRRAMAFRLGGWPRLPRARPSQKPAAPTS
jgi:hypothetical protein